jgi:hypothetical protein
MKTSICFTRRIKFLFLLSMTGIIFAGTQQLFGQVEDQEILGKWLMESNGDGFLGGQLTFKNDGTYEFNKKYPDGTGAEVKGGYTLNPQNRPAQLKLCLGDCNAAGSEWTTQFCNVRLNSDDRLELYISSGGNFPDGFPADTNEAGMYVFVKDK